MTTTAAAPRWIPDNSAIKAFRESPELFRLAYRQHLRLATPNDKMNAGSALHAGRNVLYNWRSSPPPIAWADLPTATYPQSVIEDAVCVTRAMRGDGGGHRSADQLETIIRTYAAKYAVEPFAVVENEKYVEARIHTETCYNYAHLAGDDRDVCLNDGCFNFCGIQDAVVRFPDGSEYVKDLKSTGAYLNASWEDAVRLGDQFVGYVAMRRALGYRCDGFFVDGIHVKDAKPRKDGSLGTPSVSEDDFVRVGPVSVPEWRIQVWADDMRYTLSQIRYFEETRGIDKRWPAYQNWAFGKVDVYREFYETPEELHAQVAMQFERRPWSPQQVAEERKVT